MSGDNKFTVYVAMVAAIPGILASIPALLNSSVSKDNLRLLQEIASNQKAAQELIDIRQAKLDERDLIIKEGGMVIPLSLVLPTKSRHLVMRICAQTLPG